MFKNFRKHKITGKGNLNSLSSVGFVSSCILPWSYYSIFIVANCVCYAILRQLNSHTITFLRCLWFQHENEWLILKCLNHFKIGRKKRNECHLYQKVWSFGKENRTRKVAQHLGIITVWYAVLSTHLEYWIINYQDSVLFCFSNTVKLIRVWDFKSGCHLILSDLGQIMELYASVSSVLTEMINITFLIELTWAFNECN